MGDGDVPELGGISTFDLFDGETARLDRFYGGLPQDRWAEQTRCAGWSRKDLLAHLGTVEDYTEAGLDDDLERFLAGSSGGYADLNERDVRARSGWSPEELLGYWREKAARNRSRLRERGRDGELTTSVGPYPVGRQVGYLASELAIHADDAGVPIEADERAARLEWRARFGRAALAEARKSLVVEVGPGGHTVHLGELTATLSDEDFVEAVSGRLPETHPLPTELREALEVLT